MMDEVIQVQDAFYILSSSSRVDDRTHVLKQGDTFAVFDRFGDFEQLGRPEVGLYHQDTRFLSRLALRLRAELIRRSSTCRSRSRAGNRRGCPWCWGRRMCWCSICRRCRARLRMC
jgi:hypothetical protein